MSLRFANGSVGTVSYFANGSSKVPKEYVEIHRAGESAILTDYKEVTFFGRGKPRRMRLPSQNRGRMYAGTKPGTARLPRSRSTRSTR